MGSNQRIAGPRGRVIVAVGVLLGLASLAGFSADAHASTVAAYAFAPSPIAQRGSLAPGATAPATVTALDSANHVVAGATIYLSISKAPGGGSATAGPAKTPLTSAPASFTTDTNGRIALTYHAPNPEPTTGQDLIKAENAATGATIVVRDGYAFGSHTVAGYRFSPAVILKAGTMQRNSIHTMTVKAGGGVPNVTIYLALHSSTGSKLGSASVGSTALSSTPHPFVTDAAGVVTIDYQAPNVATLPTTGTDTVTAQNTPTSPTITNEASYSYGKVAHIKFTPSPIAPTGTLGGGKTVTITLVLTDASGNAVVDRVHVYFKQAPGGGSAMAFTKALGGSDVAGISDSHGAVTITYKTPSSPPKSGTDTITGANAATNPTITATDTYTF